MNYSSFLGLLTLACTGSAHLVVGHDMSNIRGAVRAVGFPDESSGDKSAAFSVDLDRAVKYRTQSVGEVDVFYREAGSPDNPTLLLLHGFPSSSHMFRDFIPLLSAQFHIVAPDFPGFGSTVAPADYNYTFDNLGGTMIDFVDAIGLDNFSMYIFDYGAPVGFRIALAKPEEVTAIVTQNGNAYFEGFVLPSWEPIMRYWANSTDENRDALRGFLTLDTTKFQYVTGAQEDRMDMIGFDGILHDQAILDRDNEIQLDLFLSYASNVEQYPAWHQYMVDFQPKVLAIWAENDIFFGPPGAEAFKRHVPDTKVEFVNASHFALETHALEIAQSVLEFLDDM